MAFTLKLNELTVAAMLADLRSIALHGDAQAASNACAVVANMIASAGTRGGAPQVLMMRRVEDSGFAPCYYASGIRVTFTKPE